MQKHHVLQRFQQHSRKPISTSGRSETSRFHKGFCTFPAKRKPQGSGRRPTCERLEFHAQNTESGTALAFARAWALTPCFSGRNIFPGSVQLDHSNWESPEPPPASSSQNHPVPELSMNRSEGGRARQTSGQKPMVCATFSNVFQNLGE